MKYARKWLRIYLWLMALVIPAVVLIVVYPWIVRYPVAEIYKIYCNNSGREFLTYTNGNNICVKKYEDAGKRCRSSDNCLGFCVRNERGKDGYCSDYSIMKQCLTKYSSELEIRLDEEPHTLTVCPPERL